MLPILGILNKAQVEDVRARLDALPFIDGKRTALSENIDKDNLQADLEHPLARSLSATVQEILLSNYQFQIYAWPSKWSQLRFARYGGEQHYGRHLDMWTQLSAEGDPMRRDISFTLFLSDPASYRGGELVLERLEGPVSIKMPAGSIFLYSTGTVHEVKPVTTGERNVCIGWIQSRIRNEEQRHLLYELSLVQANVPGGEPALVLHKAISTLQRMWSDA